MSEDPKNWEVTYDEQGRAGLKIIRDGKAEEIEDRLEDLKEDLEDDGKRNYSHDENRKSPGAKPKEKKAKRGLFGGKRK